MFELTLLSDTHTNLVDWHPKETDGVLIHCGDLTSSGTRRQFTQGVQWLGSLGFSETYLCPGNHDGFAEKHPAEAVEIARQHGVDLCMNETREIRGYTTLFIPQVPLIGSWPFTAGAERRHRIWDAAPKADIVIAHGPPYQVLDRASGAHLGCQSHREYLGRYEPVLSAFGHIHEDGGKVHWLGRTLCVNAAVLDEEYRLVRKPRVALVHDDRAFIRIGV